MEYHESTRRHGTCIKFLSDFRALFIKTFFLTIRKPGQTIAEILLAYTFMGLLLGMRYILDRRYYSAYQIPRFNPYSSLSYNVVGNITYYYPGNICAATIATNAVHDLNAQVSTFPTNIQAISDPTLSTLSNTTLQSLTAFIQFTNLDSCTNASTMPDEVQYTLRMQENGPNYYHAQDVMISPNAYMWQRAPEDFCQSISSFSNYLNRFLGVQYSINMNIIKYVTNTTQNLASSIFMNHFGCPAYYSDQLQSIYGFFIPIFFSIVFVVTFIMNVGYVVQERENKTKEYLRIYGLRTWINNLVWVTRSMIIYFILSSVVTVLSLVVLPSSNSKPGRVSKALFNYTHWTVLWTILFVYSIQVSAFSVLFGQFFKRPLLAKLLGFVVWVITFIDFYPGVPVGARYFLCILPNAGLMFCLQVVLQYERRGVGITTFNQLYSNVFSYPLYIGICLLLMLIYSVIYLFLAIYVERVNPGEFGVAQSWNYLFKRSYWKPSATSVVKPSNSNGHIGDGNTNWIEMSSMKNKKDPSLIISHLTKKFGKFEAVSDLSLKFYAGEVCSLLGHNGAGKTTTTFILVGMLEATSGQVTIEGLDSREHIQDIRKILGFCPQYDILYEELSVKEHLELVGKMRHMKPDAMKQSIDNILQLIGLVNDQQTLSKNLSGGMKRRLSIGISFMGDPKILILDEPTSGIDPYNRRLIWTIIRKMKESGKCIILTTHFLEEADVLSDRIAIMTSGRLQANGTPDFLKSQIEFEYRLFIDKQETYPNERVTVFIQKYLPNIVLERESSSEMVFGIRRNESKKIGRLVHALDEEKLNIGVENYGLSMTTIEEVFLKLIREAEEEENGCHDQAKSQFELANRVFRMEHKRETGITKFCYRICALLIKRIHVLRRQYVFLVGFFLFPILIEILMVSVFPSPQDVQASLVQNNHVAGAQVTFQPSIYNPQTIVTYANNNGSNARTNLMNYLQNTGATIDEISSDTVLSYTQNRYYASEDIFVNKYQIALALYNNLTSTSPSLTFNSYFSTVNYHAMPVSLSAASTNLFQFYANSTTKKITTTNQPIITTSTTYTALDRFFEILYCFDTLPLSLFNFINSIVVSIFISILIVPLIQERRSHSKDLQLLTNLSKRSYWFSNFICDICSCFILCSFLIIIVKIGAAANPNIQSEVHIYINYSQSLYFFATIMMYSLASLPLIYVYSFSPKSELIGFINFFVINVVACFLDMVLAFMGLFSQSQSTNATHVSKLSSLVLNIRWAVAVLFPSVNFKRSLFNIRLRSNPDCVSAMNSIMFTNYSATEPWTSLREPGIGIEFVIFCVQILFWWIILAIIENKVNIKLACGQCCCSENESEQVGGQNQLNNEGGAIGTAPYQWSDAHLDEDVRNERQSILRESTSSTSSVVLVRDLVQQFKKRKNKSSDQRIYTAVDHLNFRVTKKSCFGANGAGKTTTFRMLINDLKPASGDIFINGKNINKIERDLEIGFCPQFDWLISNLTVRETLTLFARLKGLKWSEISEICGDMINLFGLEPYEHRRIERLSGGNKRKVSAALAFMANPALVFLDEPTTGLDAAAKRKLWNVIRAARDIGLTIILTSHSMEECEALCTKIGIMKLGQFMCLGNLQRLKNRFGNGYAVQVKLPLQDVNVFKEELMLTLPGVQFDEQHNGMLFCTVPFASINPTESYTSASSFNLAHIFDLFNKKAEEKSIESYSITQTTLEQIFVHLSGEDHTTDANKKKKKK
ncbi:unnamed protein product [Adineta steineri]|uniref:ABC transporter domain-containing protein n=1 Tax=Adineta steineri TaxID=433720 RepID=A0A813N824_9BILA|nr:unnamed protein product [Adineta steineri]CAF1335692.1 unnamed protein product [Adineta steineri]CAF1337694.1 unnamed protein product [Adineta steineri]